MPKFGNRSKANLETCHEKIQDVLECAIEIIDFSVIEGHRNAKDQNKYFDQKKSKLKFPMSKHNKLPSNAVDVAPYPIDWKDHRRFRLLAGIILGIAHVKGIKMRWGGDWNMDGKFNESFLDLPHIELL